MTSPNLPTVDLVVVTPADVAAWLRARTVDDNGREVGAFTAGTRPTDTQVQEAIVQARNLMGLSVGRGAPAACLPGYVTAVALSAACIIEKSYYPEQILSGRSPYAQLATELERATAGLGACISNGGAGPGAAGSGVYDVFVQLDRPSGTSFVPANWDDPEADDTDEVGATNSGAQAWLDGQQAGWGGYNAEAPRGFPGPPGPAGPPGPGGDTDRIETDEDGVPYDDPVDRLGIDEDGDPFLDPPDLPRGAPVRLDKDGVPYFGDVA